MKLNTEVLFYIYVTVALLSIIIYGILKCRYNIHIFDKYLYIDQNSKMTISDMVKYFLSHFVVYFVFGFIFGLNTIYSMFLKTIVLEMLLIVIKECDVNDISQWDSAILSIFIGMLSFYLGGVMRKKMI